ncbi:MAG: DUF3089 domain-containing protein [Eubacteriales bacterium]|nr:DUF3089 domain-containing protein [Eubacteriales bacterium]MDY3333016.1 DUF3089 domain-containing protein [Gallibacter sp.]
MIDPFNNIPPKPDYSKNKYWISKPPLLTKEVDTFYVYPSVYVTKDRSKAFTDVNDDVVLAAKKCLKLQASVYEDDTNIFSPFYRQISPYIGFEYIRQGREALVNEVVVNDVIASFKYYMENLNNGRPFILAGHSQGTTLLLRMLEESFSNKPKWQENMIAAYLIGYGVPLNTVDKYPFLKFAKGELDTGGIISFNTVAPAFKEPKYDILAGEKPFVINPINWKTDESHASSIENKGTLLRNGYFTPGLADAKIDKSTNLLHCSTMKPDEFPQGFDFLPYGSFHTMDYGFYYGNIKENVGKRINKFLNKNV